MDKNQVREYIGQIRLLCDKVLESLDDEGFDDKGFGYESLDNDKELELAENPDEQYIEEDIVEDDDLEEIDDFDAMFDEDEEEKPHKKVMQLFRGKKKNEQEPLPQDTPQITPYIIRKRNGEKILVKGNVFKLGKEEAYVDYCILDNPTISRNHADIVKKDDGYYVTDKGSLNHTFVDGTKIPPETFGKLEEGCLIQLADEVFEWHTV
jgi:hypothetical protein